MAIIKRKVPIMAKGKKSGGTESREVDTVSTSREVINPETGEVTVHEPQSVPVEFQQGSIKVKRHVTIPTLSWPENATIVFSPETAIRDGKELKGERGGKAKFGKARVMVIKAPNGSLRQLIVGAVLEGELVDNYPNDSYVGKWFQARKFAPNVSKGQRYATYSVQEIEEPMIESD